ncbi:Retrovirus-related Pol polyprotein from transposon RE1 [Vitis vinifera]|uniref:Retrovirus-related Pol polyprotein from transposon RE1 n=1 Tax=Vitis vinifera TaxID=29760 RepID=A0A438GD42_VITVI|nr:Retrovirus-related Pol polyprotein from transposon RE1 [Vitis vinifera]
MKKAMMATWSESEESSEEENEKEVANMCFMAIDDLMRLGDLHGKLQIEDIRKEEEVVEDPKKEESPLALPPHQQVQGESSQDLPKDWKFVINHPQDQIIGNPSSGQLKKGTFINQVKYIRDLLKRFNMEEAKTMKTPMSSSIKLDIDEKGKPVNSTMYRGMIGSLLYLTASRLDIIYLKGTMDIGLRYPKGDNFELIGYLDADFAGCKVERKNTSDTCHFLGHSLVSWHSKKQNSVTLSMVEAEYIAAGFQLLGVSSLYNRAPQVRWMDPRRETCTSMAQGKCPVEPSQLELTKVRRKARYGTTLFQFN